MPQDTDVLKLFVVGTGWGVPFSSSAPFPLKLETWLRMAQIPYQVEVENNLSKGPKGKTPWIEQGDLRMGDSELIMKYLGELHGVDIDAHLDPVQRAHLVAYRRMFEEHFHQAFEHQLFFGRGAEERTAAFAATAPFPCA